MLNNTTKNINESRIWLIVIAYYDLSLVIIGTLFNFLTLIILNRSKFKDVNERPTLYYMRTIAIFDILMLYGWNLNNYTSIIHGFDLAKYTIITCKCSQFFNYFTHQTSTWLHVFICFDRYLLLSRLNRTWFSRSKSVLIIILCIISFFILFNIHIIIFGCFYDKNGLINLNSYLYNIYPLWDFVNLVMYNCLPFLLMVILNSSVIYHLIILRRTTIIQNSRIRYREISITLVITTFLFLIMTTPTTVAFGFYINKADEIVLYILDAMLYTYYILSFPLYIITFDEFQKEFIKMITCNNNQQRIAPQLNNLRPM